MSSSVKGLDKIKAGTVGTSSTLKILTLSGTEKFGYFRYLHGSPSAYSEPSLTHHPIQRF